MNGVYLLHMTSGPTPGQTFQVDPNGAYAGRAPNNQIVVNDSRISRQHARFYVHGGHLVVQDLQSGNGTLVNGVRLTAPTILNPGDSVDLGGGATLFVQVTAAQVQPVAAPPPVVSQPYTPAPGYAAPQTGAPRRRKGNSGCWLTCGGCLGLLVLLGALAVVILMWRANAPSKNMTIGRGQTVASATVPSSGGSVTVDKPDSPVNGLTINVPAGAYDQDARISISTSPIESHELGPLFNPVTPLITVDGAHDFAAEPMIMEIPLQLADGEFAMAFFYDRHSGTLEGIPIVDLTPGKLTIFTHHFSDVAVTKTDEGELQSIFADSGFVPGVDDWQFPNDGSWLPAANGGFCAGESMSAMWYYFEKTMKAKEPRLYGRFDNNNFGATPGFKFDDSWGIRLSSVVQDMTDFDAYYQRTVSRLLGSLSDRITWDGFVYSMALTHEPQYVTIGRYVEVGGEQVRRGHAIIAYKVENGRIYVADPNYPGATDRFIVFDGSTLQPYASGANAVDIAANGVRVYTEIRYLAKSAGVDWDEVGRQYDLMLANKAGEGRFPAYTLQRLVKWDKTTNATTWEDLPQVLELTEQDTADVNPDYRGKIVVGVPRLWNGAVYKLDVYDGTTLVSSHNQDATGSIGALLTLTPGVHNYGFYIQAAPVGGGDLAYFDFQRVRIIYEAGDVSGGWTGTWQIVEANKLDDFVKKTLASVLVMVGLAENEQEARETAEASVEEAPDLRRERPLAFTLTPPDPNDLSRYHVALAVVGDDGSEEQYEGQAKYEKGVLTFSVNAGDGSAMSFTGELVGKDSLKGTFSFSAWGIVKDAVTGVWQADRQPNP